MQRVLGSILNSGVVRKKKENGEEQEREGEREKKRVAISKFIPTQKLEI